MCFDRRPSYVTGPTMLTKFKTALTSCRRESAKGWGYATAWFLTRFHLRFVRSRFVSLPSFGHDDIDHPLTVVIPAADKDAPALASCLRAAKEMVRHRVVNTLVVAPASAQIERIAKAADCTYVHEDEILPRPARDLECRGWLIQQLIKFNAAFHVPTEDYLVLDSDTVFLCPQYFFRGGKTVLRYSDQYELLYNPSLQMILGTPRRYAVSFVTHHMMFNATKVKTLLAAMEQRFGRPWHEIVLHEVNHRNLISFSEYELYGNYLLSQPRWRHEFLLEYWRGRDCQTDDLPRLPQLRDHARGRLNSISFHWHTQ